MIDDLGDIVGVVVVGAGGAVHAGAVVVHADHRDLKPFVAGHLAEGRQAMD